MDEWRWQRTNATPKFFGFAYATLPMTCTDRAIATWPAYRSRAIRLFGIFHSPALAPGNRIVAGAHDSLFLATARFTRCTIRFAFSTYETS